MLAQIEQSHILPVIDAGFHQGISYIVTKYAEYGSLRDCLHQHPGEALPLQEALRILQQIGSALQFAHEPPRNTIHRDIKPGNILIFTPEKVCLT